MKCFVWLHCFVCPVDKRFALNPSMNEAFGAMKWMTDENYFLEQWNTWNYPNVIVYKYVNEIVEIEDFIIYNFISITECLLLRLSSRVVSSEFDVGKPPGSPSFSCQKHGKNFFMYEQPVERFEPEMVTDYDSSFLGIYTVATLTRSTDE